jgi:hypothetical protein
LIWGFIPLSEKRKGKLEFRINEKIRSGTVPSLSTRRELKCVSKDALKRLVPILIDEFEPQEAIQNEIL